jgi:putative oxidoreductase
MDLGILILRTVVGLTLAAHGAQKLFGWFGGHGIAGTGAFFEQLGFRPGKVQAALAGLMETGGGLLLAAGFLTPLAAASIVAVMLVAIVSVHASKGFFAQSGGYEYPLILGAAAAALGFTGPGAFSVDAALGLFPGPAWGVVALVAGLSMGAAPLVARRTGQPAEARKAA